MGWHPLIDNNICFAGVSVEHDGFELTRQEKIAYVVDVCKKNKKRVPDLIVCRKEENGNCSRCEKCLQTMTGLLAAGLSLPSCGFQATTEQVISRVKEAISSRSLRLTHIFSWHWKNIQKSLIGDHILSPGDSTYDLIVHNYLSWLLTIDFDTLHQDRPRHEPIDMKLLTRYWQ